jgi:hypothetical protein
VKAGAHTVDVIQTPQAVRIGRRSNSVRLAGLCGIEDGLKMNV